MCSSIDNQTYMAVRLSAAAYCKANSTIAGLRKIYNPVSDLEGFVGVVPELETIYVVLRGSASARNWVKDLEILQTDYPPCAREQKCKVHDGFYFSAVGVQPQIDAAVAELGALYPYYDVVFTGHSYGAATATLAAATYAIGKPTHPIKVITFGEPRVGNAAFADYINGLSFEIHRHTHDRDMVPHLPPVSAGYWHHGREFFETNTSHIHQCVADAEDKSCAEQYTLEQTNVADHMVYLGVEMGSDGCKQGLEKI
jgi:predicted lipase